MVMNISILFAIDINCSRKIDEELDESHLDDKYEVEHISTIPTSIRTKINTPIIVNSSSSHVAQTRCCCGRIYPQFNPEVLDINVL